MRRSGEAGPLEWTSMEEVVNKVRGEGRGERGEPGKAERGREMVGRKEKKGDDGKMVGVLVCGKGATKEG